MIKVAMIAHLSELSGAGTALVDKAANIDRNIFDTHLILPDDGELADFARRRGVIPHIIKNEQVSMAETRSIAAKINLLRGRRKYIGDLVQFFTQNSIDLVFINSTAAIFAGIAAQRAGIPILWMVHEVLEHPSFATRIKMTYIAHTANAIVWDSNLGKSFFPAPPKKPSLVFTNFVDINRFRPKQIAFPKADEPITILCNGPFPRKGADIFLKAAQILTARTQRQLSFVLIGPEMPQYNDFCAELHRIADSPELRGKVTFGGIQKNVPAKLTEVDIFVSASRNEAYPIIVLEAMASALPVICTDVGDCKIIIGTNNERGTLIPPEAPEQMANAMLDCMNNPAHTEQQTQAALEWIQAKYDGGEYWKPLEDIMRNTAHRN